MLPTMMSGRALEPLGRRRKASRVGTCLSYWRVILLAAALIATFVNLNRLLNNQHAEHVSGGIKRKQVNDGGAAAAPVAAARLDGSVAGALGVAKAPGSVGRTGGGSEAARAQLRGEIASAPISSSGAGAGPDATCHVQPHTEYGGSVVKWGDGHLKVCGAPDAWRPRVMRRRPQ